MSEIVFPEGLNPNYKYVTGGDYLSKNIKITNVGNLYRQSTNYVIDVQADTSNVTNMSSIFYDSSLQYITLFDTSNVTNMSNMFQTCISLITTSQFDTSNVTNMSNMFNGCSKLIYVPLFDTSNVTNMSRMFYQCTNLTSVPLFDTSNVTNMNQMFNRTENLLTIPQFDTSNVTDMEQMFYYSKIVSIPLLDCGKINYGSKIDIVGSYNTPTLTDLGGFKDLGKVSSFNKPSYFLKSCPNLTKESVLNVINNLYDRASAGYSVVTLPFNSASLALLSDEEKAIATNKGWTLATS